MSAECCPFTIHYSLLTIPQAVVTYKARFYRDWVKRAGFLSFEVAHRESDLMVRARSDLRHQAEALLAEARREIETEICRRPDFAESLSPLPMPRSAGPVVRAMIEAAHAWDVGPMAAVAGAVAAFVGEGLLRWTPDVIVENGGDIFLKMDRPVELGLYAGEDSPFSGVIGITVKPEGNALGVCTSSGTVGHSLSFGRADAVVAVAESAALADAAATAIANRLRSADDVERVLNEENVRGLLKGLVVIIGKRMGAFGAVELSH